jgi:hypothetical protein
MWFFIFGVLKAVVCNKERECWHTERPCASPTATFFTCCAQAMLKDEWLGVIDDLA